MSNRFTSFSAVLLGITLASCAKHPAAPPTSLPSLAPALGLSPTPSPAPSPSPAIVSVLYARDIQHQTSSQTCALCHSGGGSAPQRALGTYAIDSIVNATKLRSMLWQYGHASDTQLAQLEVWIKAGRPQTEIVATSSPQPSASATPTPAPNYLTPHASNWRSFHGNVVEAAGGVQYTAIASGQTCATCHTTTRAANGTIPTSPAAFHTCFSCHNGPGGELWTGPAGRWSKQED